MAYLEGIEPVTNLNRFLSINMYMKVSEETRKKISEGRRKWMDANPDKHPWRKNSKFKSIPCENVKKFLTSMGVSFVEEFDPEVKDRRFSIDIALPDKKIAIEINGNQHYEKNGKLKPYYQERHDLIEANGWDVYQIHYSACFKLDKWINFFEKLKNSPVKIEFDYFNYTPKKKREWFCIDCGINLNRYTRRCVKCRNGDPSQTPTGNISLEERCDMRFHQEVKEKFCLNCGVNHYSKIDYCEKCKSQLNESNSICNCGNFKNVGASKCVSCYNETRIKKVENRPKKDELEKLIWQFPFTKLGEMYGVSDNAVRKWCKTYGITNFPSPSYRANKFLGKF